MMAPSNNPAADTGILPFTLQWLSSCHCALFLIAARDGTVRLCNNALLRRLGRNATDVVGRPLWSLLAESDAEALRALLQGAGADSREFGFVNFLDAGGVPFSLEGVVAINSHSILLLGEEPESDQGYDTLLLELNNQLSVLTRENAAKSRELEDALDQLRAAQSGLVQREKMAALGTMIAGIINRISDPLAYVSTNCYSSLLDVEEMIEAFDHTGRAPDRDAGACGGIADLRKLAVSVAEKLRCNLDGLEQIRKLVQDIRAYSRDQEDVWQLCDLEENLDWTLRFLDPLVESAQVAVATDYLPVGPVWCKPAALSQAVGNVLTNAIQASRPGQWIRMRTTRNGKDARIIIDDDGPGLNPESKERIFDPLFSTRPPGQSSGLGLSIASQILQSHNGWIRASNRPEGGARFELSFPCSVESEELLAAAGATS